MTHATAEPLVTGATLAPPKDFHCTEIWGGNGAFDGSIELSGIRGWVYSHSCDGGRGGDIHYVSVCSSGLISRLCLADVAGHGAPIARVSSEIHTLLRKYMNTLDQRRVLRDLNRRLYGSRQGHMTTAATVTYFSPSYSLSVSYAGHPPAWLYQHATERWIRLRPDHARRPEILLDLPLAVEEDTIFSRRRAHVQPGDRLLLVTDGVLEAPSPSDDLFGEERLEAVLHEQRQARPDVLIHAVIAALHAHTGRSKLLHDDVTLLVAEFVRGPRALGLWPILRNRVLHLPRRPVGKMR